MSPSGVASGGVARGSHSDTATPCLGPREPRRRPWHWPLRGPYCSGRSRAQARLCCSRCSRCIGANILVLPGWVRCWVTLYMSLNTFVLPTPSSARGRRWVSSLTRCGTILAGGSGRLRLLADWLRKHLGVHLAQSHQIFSPARHLAHGDTCVNCLKCFRTAARHQQHLRTTATCMLWTCLLVPCLSVEEMRAEEGSAVKVAKRIRGGDWSSCTATLPALQAQEPRQLTSSERSARRLTLVLCPASSTLIRTSCPGSSTSWPIGRRRVPEVAPPPSGTDGRSLVSPELCVAWDAPLDGSEVRRRRRIKPEALNMNFYTKRGRSSQANTKLQLGGCDMIIYDL